MARNATIKAVENEPQAKRYTNLDDAMRDLKFEFRRIMTQLEGDLKMANLNNAGPTNADKRRKAAQGILKIYQEVADKAFDTAIEGMA